MKKNQCMHIYLFIEESRLLQDIAV